MFSALLVDMLAGVSTMFRFLSGSKKSNLYPYDFATSGYLWPDYIIFEVLGQPEWDYMTTVDVASELQANIVTGNALARFPTSEKQAFVKFLQKVRAGPDISTYAWGLFIQKFVGAKS